MPAPPRTPGVGRPSSHHPYFGRRAVLASMHNKEAALAPPFMSELGLELVASCDVNTDLLGTFSGEVERHGAMGEVAARKVRLGMASVGCDLGLASEGSFGPHPQIPILAAGRELLMFIDDARGLKLSEGLLSETNFAHVAANTAAGLEPFLQRVGFPGHALVVSPERAGRALAPGAPIFKGVRDEDVLARAITRCAAASDTAKAFIETDMRAHMNPTRMASLSVLGLKLAQRLATLCPDCGAPGYGRLENVKGLPCSVCETPTEWVRHEIFGCAVCTLRETRARGDGLVDADPGNCPSCNP